MGYISKEIRVTFQWLSNYLFTFMCVCNLVSPSLSACTVQTIYIIILCNSSKSTCSCSNFTCNGHLSLSSCIYFPFFYKVILHLLLTLSPSSFRFVKQCQRFIEENRLSRSLFAAECLPTLITLSYDKIPNIRIAVARLLKNHVLEIGNGIFSHVAVLTHWGDGLLV